MSFLLVKLSPLNESFIYDKKVGLHERESILIELDSASTGMHLEGAKYSTHRLNHITSNYKKNDVVNKFDSDNIPLVESIIPYQNNGYDWEVYCLKYTSILDGIKDWMIMPGDAFMGADKILTILSFNNLTNIHKFRMDSKKKLRGYINKRSNACFQIIIVDNLLF